ncbi:virB8 family protein [Aurantiacibacter sp. D1-12]|uniref:virB8 family protein n=1 Tax=Aurantiacibacter sp. D1-12 TaxID=2993658 RepID=UPI00237D30CB|nr:VirB8/TrbF family protein [Aurantiacibacter sp. D1-12]MDE1466115.1 VirB8/TrbF family protein [Aurantiacibacter sp. D1-12]
MTAHDPIEEDFEVADSWSVSVTDELEKSRRIAWIVATVSAAVAVLLAIALVTLLPLKEREPYTLLVDRQTGHVEALAPLDQDLVAPDAALTRSFVVQYVIARESFDYNSFQDDYRRVGLWSAGDARQRYVAAMQAGAPGSPLSVYGTGTRISVDVRSVSSLAQDRALVRFSTTRTDPGGQPQVAQHWAAVIDYGFSNAEMSEQDRYINPLGFQVTRYRRDAETLPEVMEAQEAVQLRAVPAGRTRE